MFFALGVGTSLYIAPEVINRKKGQNHFKADMYSLGVRGHIRNYTNS